jgi:hypothetical protein
MPEIPTVAVPAPAVSRRRFRFSAIELLIALVLLFVAMPFLEGFEGGDMIEAIMMTILLLSAVLAIGGRRRHLLPIAALALPAVASKWLHHLRPDLIPAAVFPIAAFSFCGFVIVQLLRFVLRTPRVNAEVLCASLCAYLLLGLNWAFAYALVAQEIPGAFAFSIPGSVMNGFNTLYFSLVTLSTVGYGDITPVSNVARMLAAMEAMTGLLYVAVLVARLVALYSSPESNDPNRTQ